MKYSILLTIIITLNVISGFAQKPMSDPNGKWEKVEAYSDEFNGVFDRTKWDNDVNDWGAWSWEPENTWVADGKITLQMQYDVHNRGGETKYYTSGIIKSKAPPILYGYFEARMKGVTRFPGFCPAFWLYRSTSNLWTEIDIMEMQENSWNVHRLDMNTHTFRPVRRVERRHWDAPWDPKDDFHTYGCKWDEDGITWYIDGVERAYRENEFWHQALDVILSMGLREPLQSNPLSSRFPTTFETDYIRVWTYDPEGIYHPLTVHNGSSSGTYKAETIVNIIAEEALEGKVFEKWTGAVEHLADQYSPATTLKMPAAATDISASYRDFKVDSLVLDKQTLSLIKGTSSALNLSVYGESPDNMPILWSSENPNVATVDAYGLVNGTGPGMTQVIAINNTSGKADTCLVEVKEVFADSIQMNPSKLILLKAKREQLKVTFYPTIVSYPGLKWFSKNSRIASVDEMGMVRALGEGSTAIIATNYATNKSDTCWVEVKELVADSVTLDQKVIVMDVNYRGIVSAVFYPINATDKKVRWTSENKQIATVITRTDTTGLIIANSKGTTTITAHMTNGESASCIVHVGQDLGINASSISKIKVFPNPAIQVLTIDGLETKDYSIKLLNLQGKELKSINVQPNLNSATISLSNIQAGNYLIKVICDNELLSNHIVNIIK